MTLCLSPLIKETLLKNISALRAKADRVFFYQAQNFYFADTLKSRTTEKTIVLSIGDVYAPYVDRPSYVPLPSHPELQNRPYVILTAKFHRRISRPA
uniref:Uncharacterized protein n=1 Tax=Candidatus Kentrum sp. TUN TaxID=2126343 RepID=A0A450ZR15_9GAMM|nr:MAG: hypothetical protein BECKTUN1418D_GA0071000_104319 [Candidatus Kentron sp. TUN]VFK60037.1 MAG: hypothetical protein BECKTUN1418F_GA0071002_11966 [Candidatus Kentron sp. TUN]VFK69302.1 MAG: hypothetical protein BECKTUN1418E_GA0071001_11936 [Candidatus Kentron sp. TUN]